MEPTSMLSATNVLRFALIAEGATAFALLIAPDFVAQLLLGAEIANVGAAFGRLLGIALVTLVIACWPGRVGPAGSAVRAVLVYNALAAIYLAYLALAERLMGVMIWPAVVEHAIVTLLLAWDIRYGAPSRAEPEP